MEQIKGEIKEEYDDWVVECSDDEFKECEEPWEPDDPEEIDRLYTALDNGEIPELKWKCPGYRTPSPEITEKPEEFVESIKEEQDDFDFMDELNAPKLKIRNKGEETLKGSAKKKTTSLDGVINNMRRHHLLPATTN